MSNLLDFVDNFVEVEQELTNSVSASDIGLNFQCGKVYVDLDARAIVTKSPRVLDYYGGFEYIKDSHTVTMFGNIKIYFEENNHGEIDNRINSALEQYENMLDN